MGFWVYMFAVVMLMPLIMICLGGSFSKKAPKKINGVFGYRTSLSMKNRETWEFAHHYFGKLWKAWGWPLLALSVIIMLLLMKKPENVYSIAGGVLCVIQLIVLLACIVPTEAALKNNFDKYGRRK